MLSKRIWAADERQAAPYGDSSGAGGFTLIEIVLVLFLLAVVLTIVVPRIGFGGDLPSVSRQFIAMARSLFAAAPSSKGVYKLYIDLDRRAYWAMLSTGDKERQPTESSLAQRVELPSGVRFLDVTTLQQGKVATGRAVVQFFPSGRTEPALVHLADENQHVLTLRMNPLTGAIKVLAGYVEPPPPGPFPDRFRPFFPAAG